VTTPLDRLRALPIWQGEVRAEPLGGGITNINFVASDDRGRVVVRIGDDIPVHQILRFNEPAVLYHEPGALVIDFLHARTLSAADFAEDAMLDQALALVARAHRDIPAFLRGPVLAFWVFHVIRDYAGTLRDRASVHAPLLPDLLREAAALEAAVGPVDIVFGHNDLLPANFLHDGTRLWLIDWDYAGFNSPLFDLGGLAANNGLSPRQEARMLETYFDRPADALLWRRYLAMKAASALRETLWSMVSEIVSDLEFDFATYTQTNLATYRAARDVFTQS
jgi:thiamine kinase-like enzyme